MTTIIVAPTYSDAYDTARAMGLRADWIYPHDAILLRGVVPARIVYVNGWSESEEMASPEVMQALQAIYTPDTPVTLMPPVGQPGVTFQGTLRRPFATPADAEPPKPLSKPWGWRQWVSLAGLGVLLGSVFAVIAAVTPW